MNAEQMQEITQHFDVGAESLRSDIRQVAEGYATIRHELQEQRGEIRDEFREIRALMRSIFLVIQPGNLYLALDSHTY